MQRVERDADRREVVELLVRHLVAGDNKGLKMQLPLGVENVEVSVNHAQGVR